MERALARMELVVERRGHFEGIAVDGAGAVFVSDRTAGTILKLTPGGRETAVVEGLRHPAGLLLDGEGRLVVVERGGGRLLRVDEDGEVTMLAWRLKRPRWIAAGPDGSLFVTAQGLVPSEEEKSEDEGEAEVIARLGLDGRVRVFADQFRGLQALTVEQDVLLVAARGHKKERHATGALYSIPIEPDGRAGPATALATNQFVEPIGLADDWLGAHFFAAKSLEAEPWHRHVILRVGPEGTPTLFAESLVDPRGLAFGPDGSLYLADGRSGRVLRFVAPRPPALEESPPAVTSQRQIALRLRTEAGAQITVLGGHLPVSAMADQGGSALVPVSLRANAENHLLVFATAAAGRGLTSARLEITVVHDDEPPSVELMLPIAGSLVRGTIAVEASASDQNGVAEIEFRLDGSLVGLDSVAPFRVNLDTRVVADGPRTLSAIARDRAGNVASGSAQVTVDNTPPEVRIVRPVSGVISSGTLEIIVDARDATSGIARVELAVNGVVRFVSETPPYRFQFDPQGVGAGPYVLGATAADRAGNRGESARVSVALSGVTVGIGEPADGAQVAAGLVLVRGRVEAGGSEVGVSVNGVPAAVQGSTFGALVPVGPHATTLTAVASTNTGATTSHDVAVIVSEASAPTLVASPQSGVAPLTISFSPLGASAPATVTLDFDGDGTIDFTGPSLEGPTFTYTQPGLYFPIATIADGQGQRFTASGLIQVYDPTALDFLLQTKWTAMKDALRRGDINAAVESIVLMARDDYRDLFAGLTVPLSQIDIVLTSISAVSFDEERAEYQMMRVDNGVRLSYFVLFVKDLDGIWRLGFF